MPQQLLNGAYFCTVVEHVGGERMAENVWRTFCRVDAGSVERSMDYAVDKNIVHGGAGRADEEKFARGAYGLAPDVPVAADHIAEFVSYGYYSFFITLSEHF